MLSLFSWPYNRLSDWISANKLILYLYSEHFSKETFLVLWANIGKSSKDFSSTLGQLRKFLEDRKSSSFFPCCKVKMNIASSKSIWGHGDRFDGEEVSSPFARGGWGHLLLGRGGVVIKEKSPDFRSPEVGISEIYVILKISLHR